jgi:hypothetical protein
VPRGRIPGVDGSRDRFSSRAGRLGEDPVVRLAEQLGARIYDTRKRKK